MMLGARLGPGGRLASCLTGVYVKALCMVPQPSVLAPSSGNKHVLYVRDTHIMQV